MYRDQMNGQIKRFRGILTQNYGRMVGDPTAVHRGTSLVTQGNVQVSCARALAQVSAVLRGMQRNPAI